MRGTKYYTDGQSGFTLMVVLLALVVMTMLAIAGLVTAGDEHRASNAMRESSAAFYVAEAGLNEIYANWSNHKAAIDSLAAGDSLDLGWQVLSTGDSYRPVIHRWDTGERALYELVVHGRSDGPLGGTRALSYALTAGVGGGEAYKLGECCDAAVTMRGDVDITESETTIDGRDTPPAACGVGSYTSGMCYDWGAADVCSDSSYDKAAIRMEDTTQVYWDGNAELLSDPVWVQDPSIGDSTFNQMGDLSWDELRAMADFTLGTEGTSTEFTSGEIRPSYTIDMETGETICDTSDPLNWGSPDPNDPCFNHFPIILVKGDFAYEDSYGQAILIMDYDNVNLRGTEFDLEDDALFAGLVLGKGCIEIQYDAVFHGAIFLDGNYLNDLCSNDKTFDLNKRGHVTFSQCAVDRALLNTGLKEYAEPSVPSGSGVRRLSLRSFAEMF